MYVSIHRVTSGLVVLAKSKEAAADISKSIRDKKTVKVAYIDAVLSFGK